MVAVVAVCVGVLLVTVAGIRFFRGTEYDRLDKLDKFEGARPTGSARTTSSTSSEGEPIVKGADKTATYLQYDPNFLAKMERLSKLIDMDRLRLTDMSEVTPETTENISYSSKVAAAIHKISLGRPDLKELVVGSQSQMVTIINSHHNGVWKEMLLDGNFFIEADTRKPNMFNIFGVDKRGIAKRKPGWMMYVTRRRTGYTRKTFEYVTQAMNERGDIIYYFLNGKYVHEVDPSGVDQGAVARQMTFFHHGGEITAFMQRVKDEKTEKTTYIYASDEFLYIVDPEGGPSRFLGFLYTVYFPKERHHRDIIVKDGMHFHWSKDGKTAKVYDVVDGQAQTKEGIFREVQYDNGKKGWALVRDGLFCRGRKCYRIDDAGIAHTMNVVRREVSRYGRQETVFVTDVYFRDGDYLFKVAQGRAERIEGVQFLQNIVTTDGSICELLVLWDTHDPNNAYYQGSEMLYRIKLMRDAAGIVTGGELLDEQHR
jgi:hypothetical protein